MGDLVLEHKVSDEALRTALGSILGCQPSSVLVLHGQAELGMPELPDHRVLIIATDVKGDFCQALDISYGPEMQVPIDVALFKKIATSLGVRALAGDDTPDVLGAFVLPASENGLVERVTIRSRDYSKDPPEFYLDNGYPRRAPTN
jgi:hypothetical protein